VVNRAFGLLAEYQEHSRAEKGAPTGREGVTRLRLLPRPAERPSGHRAPAPVSDSEALERFRTETEYALITFLEVDLDLSATILKTAEMAISPHHARMALERVRQSVRVIRRLGSRIKNPTARMKIHDRTDWVEQRMNSVLLLNQSSGLQS
jgi:hypothetical protein